MTRFGFALAVLPALAGPLAAQNFGSAVATNGREVFISQPLNTYSTGFVHVYQRGANGVWRTVAQLKPLQGANFDRFGRSLSLDGNRLLIGSTSIDSSRGAAYIFERDRTGTWKQSAKLVPAGAKGGDSWGRQVLLQGDVAYVTGWGALESRGGIAIFRRAADGRWADAGMVSASDGAAGDFFGGPAVAGDLMVVGAFQRDSAKGAAYVFLRGIAGWSQQAKLVAVPSYAQRQFGFAKEEFAKISVRCREAGDHAEQFVSRAVDPAELTLDSRVPKCGLAEARFDLQGSFESLGCAM